MNGVGLKLDSEKNFCKRSGNIPRPPNLINRVGRNKVWECEKKVKIRKRVDVYLAPKSMTLHGFIFLRHCNENS